MESYFLFPIGILEQIFIQCGNGNAGPTTLDLVFGMKNGAKLVKSYRLLRTYEFPSAFFLNFRAYTYVKSKEDWYGSYFDVFCLKYTGRLKICITPVYFQGVGILFCMEPENL